MTKKELIEMIKDFSEDTEIKYAVMQFEGIVFWYDYEEINEVFLDKETNAVILK